MPLHALLNRFVPAAALTVTIVLPVSGCTGSDRPTAPAAAPGSDSPGGTTTLQPGAPGEPAATVAPGDVPPDAEWNHSDVAFVQMMIPHHEQAIEMAGLARTRAGSPRVKALARRISGAQGPEIITLAAWLQERDIEVPRAGEDAEEYDHGQHGHTEMAGMLTTAQMEQLAGARGRRFDRLFLTGMIAHHTGAVQMAESVGTDGSDVQVMEIAADVAAGQSAEIQRMRDLLREL